MAAVADLIFDQFKMALVANGVTADAVSIIYGKVIIDVGTVLGSDCSRLDQKGVVKFLTRLLDAATKAQTTANQGKIAGRRLAAVSSQVVLNNQFAITTYTFRTRHELSSVVNIIGGGVGLPEKDSKFNTNPLISRISYMTDHMRWYVGTEGNDQNNGLSVNTPFSTLKKASDVAASYVNPGNYTRTIKLLNGVHNGGNLAGYFSRGTSDYITITSNSGNKADVTIQGVDCISFTSPGIYYLRGLTINGSSGDGNAICVNNARLKIGDVTFGQASNSHISCWNHGIVEVVENYEIAGNAAFHYLLDSYAFLDTSCGGGGRYISLTGELSFNIFAVLNRNSFLSAMNVTFGGNTNGTKLLLQGRSTLLTNIDSFNPLPGNLEGVFSGGSMHVGS